MWVVFLSVGDANVEYTLAGGASGRRDRTLAERPGQPSVSS